MLSANPQHRLVREVIDGRVNRQRVGIAGIAPVAAADRIEQTHRRFFVRHDAIQLRQTVAQKLIAVKTRFVRVRRVVIRRDNEVGNHLPVRRAGERVSVVPDDVQVAVRAVRIVVAAVGHPLQNRALARGIRNHIMEARLCGVVQVVLFHQFDCFFNGVGVVQNHAEHRGRGQIRLVGLLIRRGDLLSALIGHEDAARHARVIHAIQRRKRSGKRENLLPEGGHVLRAV